MAKVFRCLKKNKTKCLNIVLTLFLIISISGCGSNTSIESKKDTKSYIGDDNIPKHQYVGEYENQPVYKRLMQIETCKDPDRLTTLLLEIYGEEFSYIKLTHKSNNNYAENEYAGYEPPYEDFICSSMTVYNASSALSKVPISSDTYLFFRENSEKPSFMMDCDATYIVYSYKNSDFDDGTHAHSVNAWVISDLFMCLHGYIDADKEEKEFSRDAVRYMDYYLELENLIIDTLGKNSGSISKTETLKPSIDILSVEITGPTMHELNVKYKINNISEKRGKVYLTCSGHAYQGELHFNDENFKNDYKEDGCFDYDIHYGGKDKPTTFTIFYGYGDFDPYNGWENECKETVSLLYTEDNGEISSNTISKNEINPLYFEGKYVGAWTSNGSKDLVEINGNSSSVPFSKKNVFKSQDGTIISVKLSGETPLFTINNIYIGEPEDTYEYDGVTFYHLLYNHEYFSINRYPNDEYIRLQNAFQLTGKGDINLYP